MRPLELVPSLSHCIENAAKTEYQEAVTEYLGKNKADAALEEKIELLRVFLESADFRKLRKESESYLMQGKKVKFLLRSEREKLQYEMLVK